MKLGCSAAVALFLFSGFLLSAQVALCNPGIPDYERISYIERTGGETGMFEQTVRLQSGQGRAYYELVSKSRDSDGLSRLDAASLVAFYSDVTTKTADSVIRRTSEILESSAKPGVDELHVSDLGSLSFALRGFPWGKASYAKLVFPGTGGGGSGFDFELRVTGRETVKAAGRQWDCWKAEMGLGGLLGGLFGKTRFWFSSASPHVLVRSEGLKGPPGSPLRILELRDYSLKP